MPIKLNPKTAKAADVIGQVADVVGQVASSVISAAGQRKNEKLRQELEEAIEKMGIEQAKELDARLQLLTSEDQKYNEVITFIGRSRGIRRGSALASNIQYQYLNKSKSDTKLMWYVLGGSVVFLALAVVLIKLKKRK